MATHYRSGEWRTANHLVDYRVERLSDMLVERATWIDDAPQLTIGDCIVAAPRYIWFRFWLLPTQRLVEKYFDADGETVGLFVPVTLPFVYEERTLLADGVDLALWIVGGEQVTVLGEPQFEASVAAEELTADAIDYAEQTIRELTLTVAQGIYPPAIIRNFELNVR